MEMDCLQRQTIFYKVRVKAAQFILAFYVTQTLVKRTFATKLKYQVPHSLFQRVRRGGDNGGERAVGESTKQEMGEEGGK